MSDGCVGFDGVGVGGDIPKMVGHPMRYSAYPI